MTATADSTANGSSPSFLTNHARVLLCVADDCNIRMRDIADSVGITERAAYGILNELVARGYLSRERQGRRNCYTVHRERMLQEAPELEDLGKLLEFLSPA